MPAPSGPPGSLPLELDDLSLLFAHYREDLIRVRAQMQRIHDEVYVEAAKRHEGPQFDDLNAELSYILIREEQPEHVVEISPCGGWSSCWFLQALRDNGHGELHSFDLMDGCTRNVPASLAEGRWTFHRGPIQLNTGALPERIDYLVVDSDHRESFARWYLEHLFPKVQPGVVVSVDDVWHEHGPDQSGGEGGLVLDWLERHGVEPFDCARWHSIHLMLALQATRQLLGFGPSIIKSELNTAIFFRMPEQARPDQPEDPALLRPRLRRVPLPAWLRSPVAEVRRG